MTEVRVTRIYCSPCGMEAFGVNVARGDIRFLPFDIERSWVRDTTRRSMSCGHAPTFELEPVVGD